MVIAKTKKKKTLLLKFDVDTQTAMLIFSKYPYSLTSEKVVSIPMENVFQCQMAIALQRKEL